MEEFTWLLTAKVAQLIDGFSKNDRARLRVLFDQIGRFPFTSGTECHTKGRKSPVYRNLFGRWDVVWWVDFPVKEIQIVDLKRS